MFYATFKDIGETDIMAFEVEKERDDWVNFKDPFSVAMGTTAENCTFDRMKLDADVAEKRIGTMLHTIDSYNPRMNSYIEGLRDI